MISKLVSSLTQNAVKSSLKSEMAIDKLIEKFKEGCPPKEDLLKIINQKNQMVNALSTVQGILTNLSNTAQTIDGVLTGLKVAVTTIKLLPVPLPPFTPLTVPNTLADTLDTLSDLIRKGKGGVGMVAPALDGVIPLIEKVINKLNELDVLLGVCIEEAGLTQEEIGEVLQVSGPFSDGDGGFKNPNDEYNEQLLQQLQPNSPNPINHRGFDFQIQYDPKNEFSFDSRRIKASATFVGAKSNPDVVLYNLPNNGYSYSSSVTVLINEAKFRVDNFLNNNPEYNRLQVRPNIAPEKGGSKLR